MVWQKFLSQHDQIFLVLSGRNPGQAFRTDPNKFGRSVNQVMADYQDRWQTAKEVGHTMQPLDGIGDGPGPPKENLAGAVVDPTAAIKTLTLQYR